MAPKQTDISLDFSKSNDWQHDASTRTPVTRLDHLLTRKLLRGIGSPAIAVRLWDGTRLQSADHDRPSVGTITITDRNVLKELLRSGDLAFGDCFSAGRLLIDGPLTEVLMELMRSVDKRRENSFFARAPRWMSPRPRLNTLKGSRENIHHHYNIGNDFYKLWLDDEMQYTCAYYVEPDFTIEQAQQAKMDHVCRKLELKPGDRVFEAGCGWGGLSRHMAKHYGAIVTAYNISHEQIAYAREQAAIQGLDGQVAYIEDDYRNIDGVCDKFVSVGMLEHVGVGHYRELGRVIDRCLTDDGRGLIHSIGRNAPRLMNRWIEQRIFPGGYPPTLGEMTRIFEQGRFSVTDVENLRLHYAQTLEAWTERYEEHIGDVRETFDEQFVRMWRLYLNGSIAAFKVSALQLFQVAFARGTDNSVPMTRKHLYTHTS